MLGVLELWRRAEASASSTESAEDVGGLLLRDPEALLLAETDEGEIVGSLIVGWDGWRGTFYRLAVDPAHRRRGLARTLTAALASQAAARGARHLYLQVEDGNAAARALYHRLGFADHHGYHYRVAPPKPTT